MIVAQKQITRSMMLVYSNKGKLIQENKQNKTKPHSAHNSTGGSLITFKEIFEHGSGKGGGQYLYGIRL